MSRRDTIIIAVLVNAGLLVVLFTSALKSNKLGDDVAAQPIENVAPITELSLTPPATSGGVDEVDQVLSQFATAAAAAPVSSAENGAPNTPNFADDLAAFSAPSTTAAPAFSATVSKTSAPVVGTASDVIEVKVKKGDMLEKLARAHNTTVDSIKKLNHLSSHNLKIGQVLKISPNSRKTTGAAQPTLASHDPKYYVVKSGDNPWTIAVKNHIKVEDLLKLNNLDKDKAKKLKPGDRLRIE